MWHPKFQPLGCKMLLNLHQSSAKPQSAITGLKLNADLGRFVRDKNPNNYIYPSNIFFFIWRSVYLSFYELQLLSWLWFFEFCRNSVVKNWRRPTQFLCTRLSHVNLNKPECHIVMVPAFFHSCSCACDGHLPSLSEVVNFMLKGL